MEVRLQQLTELQAYIGTVDAELTTILEQVQWDSTNLLQGPPMVNCKHNPTHKISVASQEIHEQQCFLSINGYSKDDKYLSDCGEMMSGIPIKFDKHELREILYTAAKNDPTFRRGTGNELIEPLTLERLQASYSTDERHAIYDAVVKAAPTCHDLADLALLSEAGEQQKDWKPKSRMEILAELRNMRRRRTKYRVAAKTRNYSDLLRDVIKTQMEMYTDDQQSQKELRKSSDRVSRDTRHKETSLENSKNRSKERLAFVNKYSSYSNNDRETYKKEHRRSDRDHFSRNKSHKDTCNYEKDIRKHYPETCASQPRTYYESGSSKYKNSNDYRWHDNSNKNSQGDAHLYDNRHSKDRRNRDQYIHSANVKKEETDFESDKSCSGSYTNLQFNSDDGGSTVYKDVEYIKKRSKEKSFDIIKHFSSRSRDNDETMKIKRDHSSSNEDSYTDNKSFRYGDRERDKEKIEREQMNNEYSESSASSAGIYTNISEHKHSYNKCSSKKNRYDKSLKNECYSESSRNNQYKTQQQYDGYNDNHSRKHRQPRHGYK